MSPFGALTALAGLAAFAALAGALRRTSADVARLERAVAALRARRPDDARPPSAAGAYAHATRVSTG